MDEQGLTEFEAAVAGEIRAVMGRRNVTRRELAARLGWDPARVGRKLRGASPLSLREAEAMLRALGEDPEHLFGIRVISRSHGRAA